MTTLNYYIIKPTTHNRKKVTYGEVLALTESQARPLRHGGFITPDQAAAQRIAELVQENTTLRHSASPENKINTEKETTP